jgi:putative ABC transport system substrate-binding protein
VRRRTFIAGLGAAAALPAVPAYAQTGGRVYRIGSLHSAPATAPHHVAFYEELARAGFVLGKNLEGDPGGYGLSREQFATHAAELVKAKVDVIMCAGDFVIRTAKQLTTTIPIVAVTEDMLSSGFVKSLSRPDGNTTGVSVFAAELDVKRQEMLLEMLPSLKRIALLADSNVLSPGHIAQLEAHARNAGVAISVHRVGRVEEIPAAIVQAKSGGGDVALNVLATPLFFNSRNLIFEKVAEAGLPAVYEWPEMAEQGGLVAYGPRIVDIYQTQISRQVTKILRGVPIAEIPVEQPTAFELVVNLKTAKAARFNLAPAFVARAGKIIE